MQVAFELSDEKLEKMRLVYQGEHVSLEESAARFGGLATTAWIQWLCGANWCQ